MTSILIVVLNWNGIEDTLACLESLYKQSYENFDILVVDNGSKDDSLQKLQPIETSGKIKLLTNKVNKGFAGGVNTGIRYAITHQYDAVALFNNDAVADTDWLKKLATVLNEKPDTAIATGLLLHENGKTIDSTGDYYSTWGMPFPRARKQKTLTAPTSGYVFGATGGASLYKTSLFKEIGLFDESFFAYYEDVDISFRAQLAGHKVYFTDKAIAYHKQGATSKKIPGFTVYQTFKNIPLLFAKNVPAGLFIPIGIRLLLLYILFFGNSLRHGTGWYALKGWLASIWYFWTKSLWDRVSIQSRKKASTSYINEIIWHDLPPDQTGMRKLRQRITGKA